mmetsp:Transcript_990/g.1576  ORF Transcript_990/g.1576 Transcript_990/m.1576 type:complete len:224 (-) Transcript_990:1079-1750(-)
MLWRHILSLGKLEKILFPVDDLYAAIWEELPNVTGVEPAVIRQHFSCFLLVFVVTAEHVRTLGAYFSTRVRHISGQVFHIRYVDELDVAVHRTSYSARSPNVNLSWFAWWRPRCHCTRLGQPITLAYRCDEYNLEEVLSGLGHWCCSCNTKSNIREQLFLDFGEEQRVQQAISRVKVLNVRELQGVRPLEQSSLENATLCEPLLNLLLETRVYPGYREENRRF